MVINVYKPFFNHILRLLQYTLHLHPHPHIGMLGKIELGAVFDTKADIKSATWKFCEMTNNTYKVKDTDAKRLRLICPDTDCSFSVYATPTSDAKWKIKTLNVVHTCDHHARKRARRMDGEHPVVKAFVAPKAGLGGRQLQQMLQRSGHTVSYKQAQSHIRRSNNLTPDMYLKELRKLESFLLEMKEKDRDGTYSLWTRDSVSYTVKGSHVPGKELRGFYVGWGWTRHFQAHARRVLSTDACHSKACFRKSYPEEGNHMYKLR